MSKSEVFPPIAVFLDGRVQTYLEVSSEVLGCTYNLIRAYNFT